MRTNFTLTIILALGLAACTATPIVTAPAPIHSAEPSSSVMEVTQQLQMSERRAAHSATLLADGRVLIAGGFIDTEAGAELALSSAELFDPAKNAFTQLRPLNEARNTHTATRLLTGQVLLVGGWGNNVRLSSVELYEPNMLEFTALNPLDAPRANHTATLLADGRVLIAGGSRARNQLLFNSLYYEPSTQQFMPGAPLLEAREGHTATFLNDGRVLLVGGTAAPDRVLASAEIFDPMTGAFVATGSLSQPRRKHAAVLLTDGRVLIIGGSNEHDWNGQYLSTEIYNPASGAFTSGPNLHGARFKFAEAVTLLSDDRVFIGGGHQALEVFDLAAKSFAAHEFFDTAYYFSTATLLNDGRVLVAGGYNHEIVTTAQSWLWH